jgi:CRP-like cAMP-binding protein
MPDGKSVGEIARATCSDNVNQCLLARFELFADLGFNEIADVEQQCRYRRFAADEHIIERESPSTELFLIVRGRVRIVNYSLSGREVTFDERGEGDYFGEVSAIDGQPRYASVVALEDSLILALGRRTFTDMLTEHHVTARRVMCRLAETVRRTSERIMDLSTLAAQDRVHAELLRQAEQGLTKGNIAVIRPIPIHSDIASRVSTTRETVARTLSDLTRKGILERQKHALVIRDLHRLEEMIGNVRG